MFKKFTNGCVKIVQNYLPDPFIFCIILTFIMLVLGMVSTGQGPLEMVVHWSDGFWGLLSFTMQMALVLVLGNALATAPPFKKILKRLSKIPKSPTQAILLVTFVSAIACFVNWGFGLVVGAIFAKELAKEVEGVDYRLLIASAYTGFLVWHGGLSGSIPLLLATGGESLVATTAGVVGVEGIPTSETIFSSYNLFIAIVLTVTLPLVNKAMHPAKDKVVTIDKELLNDDVGFVEMDRADMTPADKLENSRLITIILSVMGFAYIVYYIINYGFDLNLNFVNFIFLFLGIFLHKTPKRYIIAIAGSVKGAGPIMLQFPFYAGIMGMMTGANADGVSLAVIMSNFFINISTHGTFPLLSFLSAAIINIFVPSGGGQWALQAPIMMPAGEILGVDPARTAMTIAWGESWTNMIQPFWALPALGIAGLSAKDIMGFCVVVLLYSGVIMAIGLSVIGIWIL